MKKQPTKIRLHRYEDKYARHQNGLLQDNILSQVLQCGYCVIPNYWAPEKCAKARDTIDCLLDKDIQNEVKSWTDELQSDFRIMGADRLSSDLDIYSDKQIQKYINNLYGIEHLYGFTMAARLHYVAGNLGSGQGWHRDSCIEHQYKAILYLSDVTPDSGPFQYYRGSGNADDIISFEENSGIDFEENRLNGCDKYFDIEKTEEICGRAGTLIIANTRGIHRGKPIEQGLRYALTNYYWRIGIPQHIKPYVNVGQPS